MNIVAFVDYLAWGGLMFCIVGSFSCTLAESKYRKSFWCAIEGARGIERKTTKHFFTVRYLACAVVCGAWLLSTM